MKKFNEFTEALKKDSDDPCWKGYVQLGTKKKNGKEVPNCVPKEEVEESVELDEADIVSADRKVTSKRDPVTGKMTWSKVPAKRHKSIATEEVELEEARSSTLASLDVEEGDNIKFYASKANPRQEATVVGFTRNGKVEVKPKGSNRIVALDWTHEAVFSESVELEEAKGKLVKNMRVRHIHSGNKGTVVKGGDKAGGRVEVEYDSGQTVMVSGKFLEPFKESVEIEEGYRNIMTTHQGEKFKSKLHATKKDADDHHWKMTKATDRRGKKIYKSIETVKESAELDHIEESASELNKRMKDLLKKDDIRKKNQANRLDQKKISDKHKYAYTKEEVELEEEVAANAVAGGGVDMNPTGYSKRDKRKKGDTEYMYRRNLGLEAIKKLMKERSAK